MLILLLLDFSVALAIGFSVWKMTVFDTLSNPTTYTYKYGCIYIYMYICDIQLVVSLENSDWYSWASESCHPNILVVLLHHPILPKLLFRSPILFKSWSSYITWFFSLNTFRIFLPPQCPEILWCILESVYFPSLCLTLSGASQFGYLSF